MLVYCSFDPEEQTSMKSQSKCIFFIHENASENIVCEMAAILSRGDELKVFIDTAINSFFESFFRLSLNLLIRKLFVHARMFIRKPLIHICMYI